ncbi:MAG: hypothetical protein U1E70_03025 [Acetobacteraceae bacterium]
MNVRELVRRLVLLLPILIAACSTPEEPMTNFQPVRYDYLPPIGLNAATLEIRQQFFPSGARPDVTAQDPFPPIAALKAMAQDRLKTYGAENRAVFSILDASLTQRGEAIDGSMLVALTIMGPDNRPLGVARAQVTRHRVGTAAGLRRTLYDFTKAMMEDMNVEFEYQVRHSLKALIIEPTAPAAPVEQAPLDGRQAPPLSSATTPQAAPSPRSLQAPDSLPPPESDQSSAYPPATGYPEPPRYPASPGYQQAPGYPAVPAYPPAAAYPQAPGYPQSAYPRPPGYLQAPPGAQPIQLGPPPAVSRSATGTDPFAVPPTDPYAPR